MKFLFSFATLFVLFGASLAGLGWSLGYFHPPGRPINFTVQKGENFAALAYKLQSQGIIHSARALRWYVNFLAPNKRLQRGEFALFTAMPVPELVKVLTEGKPIEYKFTVLEGENIFQIGESLEAKGFGTKADFLAAAKSPELIQMIPWNSSQPRPANIEGYAFPDTYLLQKVFSSKEIAAIMVQKFKSVYHSLESDMKESLIAKEFNFDSHQAVTLASIVEKETGNGEERHVIASVFVNRLRKRMRLQTDPTVVYGVYVKNGSWDGNISRKNLESSSEYNTYTHDGLPPGPISNPGLNALKAVLHPASTDYLFFVSRNDGTTIFSKEYRDHAKAVRETQLDPHAREGKSWRNLPAEKRAK